MISTLRGNYSPIRPRRFEAANAVRAREGCGSGHGVGLGLAEPDLANVTSRGSFRQEILSEERSRIVWRIAGNGIGIRRSTDVLEEMASASYGAKVPHPSGRRREIKENALANPAEMAAY